MILAIRLWLLAKLTKKIQQYDDVLKPNERRLVKQAEKFVKEKSK